MTNNRIITPKNLSFPVKRENDERRSKRLRSSQGCCYWHRRSRCEYVHNYSRPQNLSLPGNVQPHQGEASKFIINATFVFQARDSDEREKWVRRLEDTILRHAHRVRGLYYNNGTSVTDPTSGTARRPNYLQTLDKRVSEADAYLQLMIEQTNVIFSLPFCITRLAFH